MEMKTLFKATLIAGLMAAATSAMAGPTATLRVTGTIVPGACTPVLSGNGIIDFGETSVEALPATGTLALAGKSITATVTCTSASKVAMSFVDNRADSLPTHSDEATTASSAFGLGKSGTVNIGSYGLSIVNINGDGTAGDLLMSSDKTAWSKMTLDTFVNNNTAQQYLTFAETGTTVPKPAAVFTFGLKATPALSSALGSITDTANLDGNATINFEYL
jgi:type 1 fimbria pilin